MSKTCYVIGSPQILLDNPDLIPGPSSKDLSPKMDGFDFSDAKLIIPDIIIKELSNYQYETSGRGKVAKKILADIRYLTSCYLILPTDDMDDNYPIWTENHLERIIEIAPIYSGEHPIVYTAELLQEYFNDVFILTNDDTLAIIAHSCGIMTLSCHKPTYTGRREVVVPKELFLEFLTERSIDLLDWKIAMPKQTSLSANEFIIMKPKDWSAEDPSIDYENFAHVGRYDSEKQQILPLRYIRQLSIEIANVGQAIYIESLMDPNITAVICTGPAGSGKTFIAAAYGIHACKNNFFLNTVVVPCNVDDKLGFLPGDLDEKLDPNIQPIKNAIRNILLREDKDIRKAKKLTSSNAKEFRKTLNTKVENVWNSFFTNIAIQHARGRDFSMELAIFDEFQDQSCIEADTLIKRIGQDGKIIITGDLEQIHNPNLTKSSSGLNYVKSLLTNSPMVAHITFKNDEVVRHPLVQMIVNRQAAL